MIQSRPADKIEPLIEKATKDIGFLAEDIEDLLSYILFPEIAKMFLKKKTAKRLGIGIEVFNGLNQYDEMGYPV